MTLMAVFAGLCLGAMSSGKWPDVELGLAGAAIESESDLERFDGHSPVTGPGIRVTVEDGIADGAATMDRLIVHERDLLLLRNELFAAGATAVSINGHRMVANSVIRCVGPTIRINDAHTAPPYVVDAAGDPDVLKPAITMMGGVVDLMSSEKLKVNVETVGKLTIPAHESAKRREEKAPEREKKND
ncbi:MAG TPA: DUF881 domain-containing protein [bacterium]|nr:DUF881 domain-containing protein [bacterium]